MFWAQIALGSLLSGVSDSFEILWGVGLQGCVLVFQFEQKSPDYQWTCKKFYTKMTISDNFLDFLI